jgi:hypothetical protein
MIKEPKSELDIDLDYYRKFNNDLSTLNDEQLLNHYIQYGRAEGRSNHMCRRDFVFSIPRNKILEIGPFTNPSLIGNHVKYFDVLDFPELVKRAIKHSYPVTHDFKIDYVSSNGDLGIVGEKFNSVFSSHCIEHQVNLIKHLNDVDKILTSEGQYYLIIPDKRYCFDYFLPESLVVDVLGAYLLKSNGLHHPINILKNRVMTTHNDPVRHWAGEHGDINSNISLKISNALSEISNNHGYIDVHAWQFTPESFKQIIDTLVSISIINLKIKYISNTPFNSNEFCVVLCK